MKIAILLAIVLAAFRLEPANSIVDRNAFQASDEAQMILADAIAMRQKEEAQPVRSVFQLFRRFFKRALRQGRAQSDSRIMMEWMVQRTERLSGITSEQPGEGLSADTIDMLFDESRCEGPTPNCNIPTVNQFRTIDGTCNNLRLQTIGASFTPFGRIVPPVYENGISQLIGFRQAFILNRPFDPPKPSARFISIRVVQDLEIEQQESTLMLMQWGQYLDHDYAYLIESSTLNGEEIECDNSRPEGECVPIPVEKDDPQFGVGTKQNGVFLSFIRSGVSCMRPARGRFSPRQQLNQITHWIDASNVYGSLPEEERQLRAFRGGLLREGSIPGTLPPDPNPRLECPGERECFLGGDIRANEQVVLTVMHTIFLRLHNKIARRLGALNPTWLDERIYQEARKIVGAIAQVITFDEYLPEILGRDNMLRLLGRYEGYDPNLEGDLPNSFGAAAFRIGHSQIQPYFDRIDEFGRPMSPLPLLNAFFNPQAFFDSGGTDPLLRGLLSQQSRKIDSFVTNILTNRLFERDGMPGMDLASLNIQRGRDHGLPSYRVFRDFCADKFGLRGQITNRGTLDRLQRVYGSTEDIDLWVGGLAEDPLPGGRIGATFACIFAITFKGLREGDRFYYENPGVFTPEQLTEIRKASLSRVICDTADNIPEVQPNAFSTVQARRPCSLLPSIDLTKWIEGSGPSSQSCYIKVQTRGYVATASVFTRPSDDASLWTREDRERTTPDDSRTRAACLEFTCPPQNGDIKIGIRARTISSRCELEQVVGALPANRARSSTTYYGVLQGGTFGPNTGIYTSEEECRSGGGSLPDEPSRGVALAYRC
ncbi:lactoperoxidase-like [Dysidea avara]|uniref:lactoperoxidase-like n=1 Tax=Dysidea avara TaxID=196820 RepID=UPI00332D5E3E